MQEGCHGPERVRLQLLPFPPGGAARFTLRCKLCRQTEALADVAAVSTCGNNGFQIWHSLCILTIATPDSAMPCAVNGRIEMIGWAVTFLIIALIAGVLGFSGVAGTAANIAWILFVVGLILAIVMFIGGRRRPPV